MTLKQSTRVARALINGDEEIATAEAIEALELMDFADALKRRLHYRGTKLRPNRKGERLTLFPTYNQTHKLVLQKLRDVFLQKKRLFNRIWERIDLSVDISVWGGENWRPYLTPNGSILFRNFHRVIGLDGRYGQFPYGATAVRDLLVPVFASLPEVKSINDFPPAFILHRESDEGLYCGCKLPEKLSDWGQTLIFLNEEMLALLSVESEALQRAQQTSRSGYAIIRTFGDTAFAYSTGRFSDELDSIVEYFSSYLEFEDLNEPAFYKNYSERLQEIEDRTYTSALEYEIDLEDPDNPESLAAIAEPFREKITRYCQQKLWLTMECPPFFTDSAAYPWAYYNDSKPPYFDLLESFGRDTIVLSIRNGGNESIFGVELHADTEAKAAGKAILAQTKAVLAEQFIVKSDKADWAGVQCRWEYYGLTNPEEPDWLPLKDLGKGLIELLTQAKAACDSPDSFYPDDIELVLAFTPSLFKPTDLDSLNAALLALTGEYDCGIALHVPKYGISQGYDCGDHDTGNVIDLLSPEIYNYDDPDEEEEPEEELDEDSEEAGDEPSFDALFANLESALDDLQAEMESTTTEADNTTPQSDTTLKTPAPWPFPTATPAPKKSRKKK
jgi:hypothetical protein